MAISPLIIPARTAASSTGYAGDMNLLTAKINELATAMAISPLTIAAAVGAGNPAADMNQVVAKVNEIIGGGTVTPPTATKPEPPVFGNIDDVNNIVSLGSTQFGYTDIFWNVEGSTDPDKQLGSNSQCSPGNVAGRLYGYIAANPLLNRLQSEKRYTTQAFTIASVNSAPTVTLSSPQDGQTIAVGQPVVINADAKDANGTADIERVDFMQNGAVFATTRVAPHTVQRMLSSVGGQSFTARIYDMLGANALSNAINITAAAAGAGYSGPMLVIPFGDSRTEGADLDNPATESYPPKLQTLIGGNYTVINRGHTGAASYDLMAVFEAEVMQPLIAAKAAGTFGAGTLILNLGVNNFIKANQNGLSRADALVGLKADVRHFVDRGLEEFATVIVTYETPNTWGTDPEDAAFNDWLEANYKSWGNGTNVLFADMRLLGKDVHDPYWYNGGIHPTSPLTDLMAQIYAGLVIQARSLTSSNVTTTPAKPTVSFDTATRILTATHTLGAAQLEMRRNGGIWYTYAAVQVDDAQHAANEWEFRVKAAAGRNASPNAGNDLIQDKSVPFNPYANLTTAFLVNESVQAVDAQGNLTKISNLTGTVNDATILAGNSAKIRTDGPGGLRYVRLTKTQLITTLPALIGSRVAYIICRKVSPDAANIFGQNITNASQYVVADLFADANFNFHDGTSVSGTIKDDDISQWAVRIMKFDEATDSADPSHPHSGQIRSDFGISGFKYQTGTANGGNIIGGGGKEYFNEGTIDIAGWATDTDITEAKIASTLALLRAKTGIQ